MFSTSSSSSCVEFDASTPNSVTVHSGPNKKDSFSFDCVGDPSKTTQV